MNPLHPLLRRQLRHLGLGEETRPATAEAWAAFLVRLSQSYHDADEDRYTIERSLALSSREMQELYEQLRLRTADELAAGRDRLEHNRAILHATLETIEDGVLVVGVDRRVVTFNRRFSELWRVPAEALASGRDETLLASVLSSLCHPDEFLAKVNHLYDHPAERSRDEIRLVDGRVFDRYSAPVVGASAQDHGRMWVFRDVTEQRRAEDALRSANRFLDSIIDNLPDAVLVKDAADLRYVRANRAAEAFMGLGAAELCGRSAGEVFSVTLAEVYENRDREVIASGEMCDISHDVVSTPHGERIVHTRKIPIPDAAGRAQFLLVLLRDITELEVTAAELRRQIQLAETANRAKSDFLANMSHELRTPLNAIVGFGRVLARGRTDAAGERQGRYVTHILEAGEHMLALVNDLLDLRRVEDPNRPLEVAAHELSPIIDAAVSLVRPLLDERRHVFDIDLPDSMPPVLCDPRALAQVLVNLLSNAAKYTEPAGRVTLRAGIGDGWAQIEVEDTGIGISPEDQAKLFTYFTQVGAKYRHRMHGSGVGLALTRALVERMSGSIELTSAPGQGSLFRVRLPGGMPASQQEESWP